MKIGIDASRYKVSETTGTEWYSWQIINGLMKLNFKEDHLILYSKEKLDLSSGVENKVLAAKRLWTLRALSKEMSKNPPDVLFVPSHTLPLKLPKRSVIMIHDVAFKHLKKAYSLGQYLYLDWSTKFAVKNATKILTPSRATADDLMKFYKCPADKIKVIYHGFEPPKEISEDIFATSEVLNFFNITPKMKYIFFVGRLETKKNLVRLIEAFKSFSEKFPEYRLILAGKRGVGFSKIMNTMKRLDLSQKVIMPGYITAEEKAHLYKHCQFFVFPSLYEGFGFPILEAFHYKKAVLCSNISSMEEVAGEAAHFVDPYGTEAIAEGLETLAAKEDYRNKLIKKGLEQLQKFSWEKCCKETLEVITHGQ